MANSEMAEIIVALGDILDMLWDIPEILVDCTYLKYQGISEDDKLAKRNKVSYLEIPAVGIKTIDINRLFTPDKMPVLVSVPTYIFRASEIGLDASERDKLKIGDNIYQVTDANPHLGTAWTIAVAGLGS